VTLPEVEPVTFSPDELRTILATVPTLRHDALVRLMAFGGLRRIEVLRLRWDDVDFPNHTLTVLGKGSGNGKLRKTPIHPAVAESLMRLNTFAPGGPMNVALSKMGVPFDPTVGRESEWVLGTKRWGQMSMDVFNRMIADVSRASRIAVKSHTFRKTLASDLYERGVRENVLESIFGWSKSTVRARHYTRIAGEEMQKAILLAYRDDQILPKAA
jgi:integrase